jgi:hypothetical protein
MTNLLTAVSDECHTGDAFRLMRSNGSVWHAQMKMAVAPGGGRRRLKVEFKGFNLAQFKEQTFDNKLNCKTINRTGSKPYLHV